VWRRCDRGFWESLVIVSGFDWQLVVDGFLTWGVGLVVGFSVSAALAAFNW
jgi:hypothetical protein